MREESKVDFRCVRICWDDCVHLRTRRGSMVSDNYLNPHWPFLIITSTQTHNLFPPSNFNFLFSREIEHGFSLGQIGAMTVWWPWLFVHWFQFITQLFINIRIKMKHSDIQVFPFLFFIVRSKREEKMWFRMRLSWTYSSNRQRKYWWKFYVLNFPGS